MDDYVTMLQKEIDEVRARISAQEDFNLSCENSDDYCDSTIDDASTIEDLLNS